MTGRKGYPVTHVSHWLQYVAPSAGGNMGRGRNGGEKKRGERARKMSNEIVLVAYTV